MADKNGTTAAPDDAAQSLSYEDARAELEAVVAQLESGAPTLEESLALWERGELLAGVCESWLEQAQQRLKRVEDSV